MPMRGNTDMRAFLIATADVAFFNCQPPSTTLNNGGALSKDAA